MCNAPKGFLLKRSWVGVMNSELILPNIIIPRNRSIDDPESIDCWLDLRLLSLPLNPCIWAYLNGSITPVCMAVSPVRPRSFSGKRFGIPELIFCRRFGWKSTCFGLDLVPFEALDPFFFNSSTLLCFWMGWMTVLWGFTVGLAAKFDLKNSLWICWSMLWSGDSHSASLGL